MKKIKTILYIIVLSTFFKVDNTIALFGIEKINTGLIGNTDNADLVIQDYMAYILGFLYLVAVLYGIYGGFKILSAADNEDSVKSGKTIIIQALIGIVIIFLAGPIVDFFLGTSPTNTGIIGN